MSDEALAGATVIVNISASPYHAGKGAASASRCSPSARATRLAAVAFCALVGGQDELVFDGHSFVVDHDGDRDRPRAASSPRSCSWRRSTSRPPRAAAPARHPPPRRRRGAWTPRSADAGRAPRARTRPDTRPLGGPIAAAARPRQAEVYAALVLGLRDYVRKNGFQHVVLGLSGGIDSALVALHRRRRARARAA